MTGFEGMTSYISRRHFFGLNSTGVGLAALAGLLGRGLRGQDRHADTSKVHGGLAGLPHFPATAKRVIYLFQSGGPSQFELFDYKPRLMEFQGAELPDSVRGSQRLTEMSATQASFPVVPSKFAFARRGQSGAWVSELLPHTAGVADRLTFIKSVNTEEINHDPAVTMAQTGFRLGGRPSMGAWVAYGIGCQTEDLPAFCVMISNSGGGQPLYDRLWGNGFLPSQYQGVKFRSVGDPVLYLSNPRGFNADNRRQFLNALGELNQMTTAEFGDPETAARVSQYEMAFRMQTSVPELTDTSKEPAHIFELYGEDARKPGTFAANCLLARRLAERGVRFIQLYHRDWDHHSGVKAGIEFKAEEVDRATKALIMDLKQRGMLDDTLIVFGGEFGRTPMSQSGDGRDHHIKAFSYMLAGGGIKPGLSYGASDEFGYAAVENPVSVHDFHATMLRVLGIDHTRMTVKYSGLDARLSGVGNQGQVVTDI